MAVDFEEKAVDLTQIKYYVTAVLATGAKLHLEEVAENIAWEENEKEISARLNLTLRDIPYEGGRLSDQLALCTVVYLYYDYGEGKQEAFRGTIWEWEHSKINDDSIVLVCYDLLYYLQKSSDNKYYAKGKGTKAICEDILKSWSVKLGTFSGPTIKHEKVLYKNKTISAMLIETLDEAKKKTGKKGIIRATKGQCEILSQGSNEDVWSFAAEGNLISTKYKYSMVDLVTRVVIVGKDDKKGRPKVEATINGKTEYGILQQIKVKGSSKLADAKKEAKELIKEKGKPTKTIVLQSPEFPCVRKGDQIHVSADRLDGYFYVKGVSHNATSMVMQMEVDPVE